MSKEIVPFSDPVTAFEVSEGAIVNHLSLPVGTDTERIGLKVDRLTSLVRWAGAKQLQLVNADLGYERPDMFDMQDNGGGVATAKGLKNHQSKHSIITFISTMGMRARQACRMDWCLREMI
jgi:hypothetical protein